VRFVRSSHRIRRYALSYCIIIDRSITASGDEDQLPTQGGPPSDHGGDSL